MNVRNKNLIPRFIAEKDSRGIVKGTVTAYAMFVDISGFTAITHALAAQGKEGAEVLSRIINDIFSPCIQAVYTNGGFISGFAGDAFTALFRVKRAEYPLKAAQEIRQLFNAFGRVKTRFATFRPAARFGLSFGKAKYSIIDAGVQKTWCFMGAVIDGCTAAEQAAERMRIVADAAFVDRLDIQVKKQVVGDKWRLFPCTISLPDRKKKKKTTVSAEAVSRFVPQAVLQQPHAGEFREIVACFIGVEQKRGYRQAVKQIIKTCHAFGGYFNRIDFGDKGGLMLVIFGAPTGRENLYQRAADFALHIRGMPHFSFRVAMEADIAFSGFIGSCLRSEYTALGDVVNLAARLVMRAEWLEIVVGPNLAKALSPHYRCVPKGSFALKGFASKTRVFALKAKCTQTVQRAYSGGFIGRQAEKTVLKKHMQPLFANRFGGVVYVDGPAGIGKSRFVADFMRSERDCTFFVLPCDGILRKSFNPFIHFFKLYFLQKDALSKEQNLHTFADIYQDLVHRTQDAEVRSELQRTQSVIAAAIGLEPEGSLYARLSPKGRYENTLYAVKEFFKAHALQGPCVLILEDAHWLDGDSRILLRHLTRNVETYPLMLLAVCRPNDDGSKFTLFPGEKAAIDEYRIELAAFSRQMIAGLLQDRLHTRSIPRATEDLVWEKSDGNPFFAEQIVLYALEHGLFDQAYRLQDNAHTLPSGISQIIIARIDRLSAALKEFVKTASVLGREFTLRVLHQLLRAEDSVTSEQAFFEHIATGCAEQIWERLTELVCIFKHALIRDTAYEMQLKARLRVLHDLAGKVMEEVYHDRLKDHYEELAEHFHIAENKPKAMDYAEKTALLAEDKYHNDKALLYYNRVLDYLAGSGNSEKKQRILLQKGQVLHLVGRWEDALQVCNNALQGAEATEQHTLLVKCLNAIGHLHVYGGRFEQADTCLEKALRIAERNKNSQGKADVLNTMGAGYLFRGKYDKAMACYQQDRSIIASRGESAKLASALGNIGMVYYHQGDFDKAMACYKKVLRLVREFDDKNKESNVLDCMGSVHLLKGNYQQAMACYRQAMALCTEMGDKRGVAESAGNMGIAYYNLGHYAKAEHCYRKKMRLCQELDFKRGLSVTWINLGILYQDQGKFSKALACTRKSLRICEKLGDKRGISNCLCNIGLALYERGEYTHAGEYYDRAIQLGRQLGIKYYLNAYLYNKAKLLAATGETEAAIKVNHEALEIAREIDSQNGVFRSRTLANRLNKNVEALLDMARSETYSPDQLGIIYYTLWKLTGEKKHKQEATTLLQEIYAKIPSYYTLQYLREMTG